MSKTIVIPSIILCWIFMVVAGQTHSRERQNSHLLDLIQKVVFHHEDDDYAEGMNPPPSYKPHLYQTVGGAGYAGGCYQPGMVGSRAAASNFTRVVLHAPKQETNLKSGESSTASGFHNAFTPFGENSFGRGRRPTLAAASPRTSGTRTRSYLKLLHQGHNAGGGGGSFVHERSRLRTIRSIRKRRRRQDITCPTTKYRSYDGTCNNKDNPTWGSAMQPFLRMLLSEYGDGKETPRKAKSGNDLPNARLISTSVLGDQTLDLTEFLSTFVMQWGQFLDHDITLTPTSSKPNGTRFACCNGDQNHLECSHIDTTTDPFYRSHDVTCLSFTRSRPSDRVLGREQINLDTSYIDASQVYGSDEQTARTLRTFSQGTLKTTNPFFAGFKPLLPLITNASCQGQEKDGKSTCVIVGDIRGNEQVGITITHTIWLREHNRIAGKLRAINPSWNDETLYQEARKIVSALMQQITYSEYLPILLGPDIMDAADLALGPPSTFFVGYDGKSEAGVINSFATAAFRFGHSLIPKKYDCLDPTFRQLRFNAGSLGRVSELPLRDAMLNPLLLYQNANRDDANIIDCLLRGLIARAGNKVLPKVSKEVSEHLLTLRGAQFGADLPAFNIMRGRDHGIPSYTKFRNDVCRTIIPGLKAIKSFEDLRGVIPDSTLRTVRNVYANVDDMDLFPLGLAEQTIINGGIMGPTFTCILALQFRNLKFSDSFWYENSKPSQIFTIGQLNEIRKTKFSRVICQNSDAITRIQEHAFILSSPTMNPLLDCSAFPDIRFEEWKTR